MKGLNSSFDAADIRGTEGGIYFLERGQTSSPHKPDVQDLVFKHQLLICTRRLTGYVIQNGHRVIAKLFP